MSNFLDYLKNAPIGTGVFENGELTHLLVDSYDLLSHAVRDKCEKIEVTHSYFYGHKNDQIIKYFDFPQQTLRRMFNSTFYEIITLIVERDSLVREHLELVSQTEESVTYRIV